VARLRHRGFAALEKANDKAGIGIAQLENGDLQMRFRTCSRRGGKSTQSELIYYLARATGLLSKQLYDTLLANLPQTPQS